MTVYVDEPIHPYGRMVMCHMWADSLDELFAIAAVIGVNKKWLQQPPKASWVHFDICKSKRVQALAHGAVARDKYSAVLFRNRQLGNLGLHGTVFNIRQRRLQNERAANRKRTKTHSKS